MDRRDYFYLQLLTEAELDDGFEQAEQADFAMMYDNGLVGICQGLDVTEHSPTADLTVDVAGGQAYDADGQRISITSTQVVDVSEDYLGVATDVVGGSGYSKIVSVFVGFERSLSDPRIDGNSQTVYFERNESHELKVVQGAESGGTPTPPALDADYILLADITFEDTGSGTPTQIFDADIDVTDRRQDSFVLSAGSLDVRTGTAEESDQALLTHLNNHITGTANLHPASSIDYAGGPAWENGDTNPATDAESQLDKIITDLAQKAGISTSGADRIGLFCDEVWQNGEQLNQGGDFTGSIAEGIYALIADLAEASTALDCGGARVGVAIDSVWENGDWLDDNGSLWQGNVKNALKAIQGDLNDKTSAAKCGADRIGAYQTTSAWHDGTRPTTGSIMEQINSIVSVLAETTGVSDCGADRIGAAAYSGTGTSLSTGSIMDQLKELADELGGLDTANTWTALNTFSGGVTFDTVSPSLEIDLAFTGSNPIFMQGDTSFSGSAFGIACSKLSGTGSHVGADATISAQAGQNVASGDNNDGGAVKLQPAAPGTGGTAGTGSYGAVETTRDAQCATREWTRRVSISGTGSQNYDSPYGDLSAGEGAAFWIEVFAVADTTPGGATPIYVAWVAGYSGRDSTTGMYSAQTEVYEAGGTSNYGVTIAVSNNGQTPRITVTGDNASYTKEVTLIIRETRQPAA